MKNEERKMKNDFLKDKSLDFAVRVVKTAQLLTEKKEFVLSKQLLRSGTAVGALIREAKFAESKADFSHKLSVALKEANETIYWLELLYRSDYLPQEDYSQLDADCNELKAMLINSIKTVKSNLK